ncbi:MAG TPA: hypothetical protein VFM18_15835 [Methanosarcina sp.]|nr:hypothetical protein [Methanosarcina sp.]
MDTPSCAIWMISEEYWTTGNRPTIKDAAEELKADVKRMGVSVLLATVVYKEGDPYCYPDYKWWCSVYKKAGFKQFGKTTYNPKSGNMVTKFYYDNVKTKPKEVK